MKAFRSSKDAPALSDRGAVVYREGRVYPLGLAITLSAALVLSAYGQHFSRPTDDVAELNPGYLWVLGAALLLVCVVPGLSGGLKYRRIVLTESALIVGKTEIPLSAIEIQNPPIPAKQLGYAGLGTTWYAGRRCITTEYGLLGTPIPKAGVPQCLVVGGPGPRVLFLTRPLVVYLRNDPGLYVVFSLRPRRLIAALQRVNAPF